MAKVFPRLTHYVYTSFRRALSSPAITVKSFQSPGVALTSRASKVFKSASDLRSSTQIPEEENSALFGAIAIPVSDARDTLVYIHVNLKLSINLLLLI